MSNRLFGGEMKDNYDLRKDAFFAFWKIYLEKHTVKEK